MRLFTTAVTLLVALAGAAPQAAGQDLRDFLPSRVDGWSLGTDGRYSADTLHDYIDGAAEIYLAFGVREVASRRYENPHASDVIADIFDMGSARGAFGAFRFDARTGEGAGIGRESERLGSNLAFWKGPYFVSVISFEDSAAAREAVLALGRSVAAAIAQDDPPPPIAGWLPPGGLLPGQAHYFRGSGILALLSPLGKGDALGLAGETEGILARYRLEDADPSRTTALLLVSYPSEEDAAAAAGAVRRVVGGATGDGEAWRSADGGWFAVRRIGEILLAVTDGGSEGGVRALLHEAALRTRTARRGEKSNGAGR